MAATGSGLSVSWVASTDDVGVSGYDVYRNGTLVTKTGQTSYTLGGLSCGNSYTIAVDAYDAAGNSSQKASLVASTSPCPDTTPPSAPSNLTVTATTATSVSLFWSPSLDNVAVTGYDVFQNGTRIGSATGTSYTLTGLTCNTSYTLAVQAYDAANNHSPQTTINATTSACGDSQPPSVPTNVVVGAAAGTSISLSWSASADNVGVNGYGVYLNGSRIASVATTSYSFTGLSCGTSYDLAVDAYDAAGNRSGKASSGASTSACPPPPSGGGAIKYRYAFENSLTNSASVGERRTMSALIWLNNPAAAASDAGVVPLTICGRC